MLTRRDLLARGALSAGPLPALSEPADAAIGAHAGSEAERLYETVKDLPIDDTHCHPISQVDAHTTPDRFIERLALAAFPAADYFPAGVLERWRTADEATRDSLDRQYRIGRTLATLNGHFPQTVFARFMVKEMAGFLDCEPRFEAVIEARNARAGQYARYINDLFRDAGIENAMVDTGYSDGLDAAGVRAFEKAIHPARVRLIARVETLQEDLLEEDLSFDELRGRFLRRVHDALDGTGNFGGRSYGMKSYLLPAIGLIKTGLRRGLRRQIVGGVQENAQWCGP